MVTNQNSQITVQRRGWRPPADEQSFQPTFLASLAYSFLSPPPLCTTHLFQPSSSAHHCRLPVTEKKVPLPPRGEKLGISCPTVMLLPASANHPGLSLQSNRNWASARHQLPFHFQRGSVLLSHMPKLVANWKQNRKDEFDKGGLISLCCLQTYQKWGKGGTVQGNAFPHCSI